MSVNLRQVHGVTVSYVEALARDLRAMSKAQVELERLRSTPDEWDEADHASFQQQLAAVYELTGRYRTGDSILTIAAKEARS